MSTTSPVEALGNVLRELADPAAVEYVNGHKDRILRSLEWLTPYLKEDVRALELGGESIFSLVIKNIYPRAVIEGTTTDLRYPLPIPTGQYDLIVNTELVEHIKDQDASALDKFELSGLHTLLAECHRILKKDGVMFVTTPNASCVGTIYRTFRGYPPFYFQPHVREYTVHEVRVFLEERHHFSIERIETIDVWNDLSAELSASILSILAQNGYSTDNRGECTFVVARK
jgi:SAM-dependent methyltransferase